jgi:AraC-like DNA-binding protein
MDALAFRLHTDHRVAVPQGCAVFVRGGTVACLMRGGNVLLDPNHALLVPACSQPCVVAARAAPASLTILCEPQLDFGAQPSVRLIDSSAFLEHFHLTLRPRDACAMPRLARLVQTLRETPPTNPYGYSRVMQQYISASLGRPFSLMQVARAVPLSPSAASRIFHRSTGVPLRMYVRRLRLRTALARIVDGHDLSQIALQLGFFDHAHFSKTFRAEFGISPSQWRDFAFSRATLYKTA